MEQRPVSYLVLFQFRRASRFESRRTRFFGVVFMLQFSTEKALIIPGPGKSLYHGQPGQVYPLLVNQLGWLANLRQKSTTRDATRRYILKLVAQQREEQARLLTFVKEACPATTSISLTASTVLSRSGIMSIFSLPESFHFVGARTSAKAADGDMETRVETISRGLDT